MATDSTVEVISELAAKHTGFKLRPYQIAAVQKVLDGKDVLVVVPTGMGKSIIYGLLPILRDQIRQSAKPSMVVVISPLLALMDNQVQEFAKLNIKATHLGSTQQDQTMLAQVLDGKWQVVFVPPEFKLKKTLKSIRKQVAAIVVDEAHCISSWGSDDFRPAFKQLGGLRALLSTTPVLALTATATQSIATTIKEVLYMEDVSTIFIQPNRANISYNVIPMIGVDLCVFDRIISSVNDSSSVCPKVVVYCSQIDTVSSVFLYIQKRVSYPNSPSCPVAMFHGHTADLNKSYVLSEFPKSDSKIRVVIATVAFGLGVNIKDIKTIINLGLPRNLEEFVQESGRAGRDGSEAESILYQSKALQCRGTDAAMLEFCSKEISCRRRYLTEYFKLSNVEKFEAPDAKLVSPCCDLCKSSL